MLGMRLVLAHIIQSSSYQLKYQLNAFATHFTMYWKIPIEVGIFGIVLLFKHENELEIDIIDIDF